MATQADLKALGGKADQLLAEDMARFYSDPLGFVMYAYDWRNDKTIQTVKLPEPWSLVYDSEYGPDAWACEFLTELGEEIRKRGFDGTRPVKPIRMATGSGHGIGKSTLTAWIVDFIVSTRPFCNGVVTANTGEQLSSKTWAEIGKWTKKCITGHWFEVTTGKGSMRLYHKQHPEAWKVSAQTCREENSESFAGLHAANSTPFYIFDEASAVPDQIYEVAEGGLTDGEPMFFLFGNRTRNSGAFNDAFRKPELGWITRCIDSRDVQVTNKELIADWIKIHGENSDFVKVRVRGMAPSLSANQLIGIADLDQAFGRELSEDQYSFAPKILTLDPAWTGGDETTIGLRQGLRFQILRAIPRNDNDMEVAGILAALEDEHQADAVFIDYGHGTGIYSAGETWGRNWTLVAFGSKSALPGCANKRAEMWVRMRDWIKAGGSIPKDPKLYEELSGQELKPRDDGVIQLVGKAQMEESPNRGDCLALSFAFPVQARQAATVFGVPDSRVSKKRSGAYDPYANLAQELAGG